MSTEANQSALADFWQSTVPLSQVRESLNPPNGDYDLVVTKLEPMLDDNGLVFINSEFTITAPASIANAKVGNTFRPRLYVGTKKDPLAKLPETRINAPGLAVLKGIGRVTQVPCNDQPVALLCYQCHTVTPPTHLQPSYRDCTRCHVSIHGSNTDPRFISR